MADINRTTNSMALPSELSNEIIQKTQSESAVMRLARQVALPGRGLTIPVITGDPTATWVSETGAKPVSNGTPATKLMSAYKIAVIEPFSKEFVRDAQALYNAMVDRLPRALGGVFDATVIGKTAKPGSNFDTFSSCTTQSILASGSNTAYKGLVAADTDIALHGGVMNGLALGAQARGLLLEATDTTGRPLFNSVADGGIQRIIGADTFFNSNLYKAGSPSIVGIAGDWSKAMYGTVSGVEITFSDTATLTLADSSTLNLWQNNMVAVRAEIEVGFRADTECFNLLSGANA